MNVVRCVVGIWVFCAGLLLSNSAIARVRHHTDIRLPGDMYLGDIDGDGVDDYVQLAANRVFVMRTNYQRTGVAHAYSSNNIGQVLIGRFLDVGRSSGRVSDDLCLALVDGKMECFFYDSTQKQLVLSKTFTSFISNSDSGIVGDFDGDGYDDVLVKSYSYVGGAAFNTFHLYVTKGSLDFAEATNYNTGNLDAIQTGDWTVQAGNFNGDKQDDLVAIRNDGYVMRFDGATWAGTTTFWWAFTAYTGFSSLVATPSVASLDDDGLDDLLFWTLTGELYLYHVTYSSGTLENANDEVISGQLPVLSAGLQLYWGKLATTWSERGSSVRDDVIVYNPYDNNLTRFDARWDGYYFTYWWAYQTSVPDLNTGWPAYESKPWAVLLCKFSDVSTEPFSPQPLIGTTFKDYMHSLVAKSGINGERDYWMEQSYGAYDFKDSEVLGWYTMSVSLYDAYYKKIVENKFSRSWMIDQCVNAATDVDFSKYYRIITVVNAPIDGGATGARVIFDTEFFWGMHHTVAHEMGHAIGYFYHANSDTTPSEYRDPFDVMGGAQYKSGTSEFRIPLTYFKQGGPNVGASRRWMMNWMPPNRVAEFYPDTSLQMREVTLATMNRPEANGYLLARVDAPSDLSHFYNIELRTKEGWDGALSKSTIVITEVTGATSTASMQTTLKTRSGSNAEYQPGEWFWGNNVYVYVNSINEDEKTALVTIWY